MNDIEVCRRHGVLRQKKQYVKLTFTGQDLDRAFEIMGATVVDVVCPECIKILQRWYDYE